MADKQTVVAKLAGVPLLEGLSSKELARIFDVGKEVTHPEGHEVVTQEQSGAGFHLILDGKAEVVVSGKAVTTLGPGEYFGEMSLLDDAPRSATVRAVAPLTTFSVVSWNFTPLLKKHPSIALSMLKEMSARLRRAEASPVE